MTKTLNDMIEEHCRKGLSPAQIFKKMKGFVSLSGVYKAVKRFKETGNCSPRVRSTPKRPVRTKNLIKQIREKLRRNSGRSIRKLAREASVSSATIHRVLRDDLKVKPYKKVKRQLLSEASKLKRLQRSKILLNFLHDGTQLPILWTDEKLFTVQAIHNTQNDRNWIESRNSIPVERRTSFRRQKPASVMVWAGVTSSGLKTPLIFIDVGVKINQHVYLDMLKDKVFPWVQKAMGETGITFQQDGATSHTAKKVQDWCKSNFKSFWTKELWPPSSPDLNPMDFGIWSILEQKACTSSHMSVAALKKKLTKSWSEIDENTIRATCDQIIPRLRKVITQKGSYFE